MRKQKPFNKGNYILFVDSTNTKVNLDANKNQGRALDVQKIGSNEVTFMLYNFISGSFLFVS